MQLGAEVNIAWYGDSAREALYAEAGGVEVTTGTGQPEDSAPPELKRLLQDR